jgi:hypothetical protein
MPNTILHKRKATSGSAPAAGNLTAGELAINTADGRLYTKNAAGTVVNLPVSSISGQTIAPGRVDVDRLSLDGNRITPQTANLVVPLEASGAMQDSGTITSAVFYDEDNGWDVIRDTTKSWPWYLWGNSVIKFTSGVQAGNSFDIDGGSIATELYTYGAISPYPSIGDSYEILGKGKVLIGRELPDDSGKSLQTVSLSVKGSDATGGAYPDLMVRSSCFLGTANGDYGLLTGLVNANAWGGTHPANIGLAGVNASVSQYRAISFCAGFGPQFMLNTASADPLSASRLCVGVNQGVPSAQLHVNGNFIAGASSTATTVTAVSIGHTCAASADYAIATGFQSVADRYGVFTRASGRFSANGDAQSIRATLRNTTTTATATTLFTNGSSTRLTIPSGKTLFATVTVSGVINGGSKAVHYTRKVGIKNVAGTVSLVGTVSVIGTDVEDDAAYDVAITADNTNKALQINVTGKAAETIRWVALVDGVEIAYG